MLFGRAGSFLWSKSGSDWSIHTLKKSALEPCQTGCESPSIVSKNLLGNTEGELKDIWILKQSLFLFFFLGHFKIDSHSDDVHVKPVTAISL